jgi:hypothetical protein
MMLTGQRGEFAAFAADNECMNTEDTRPMPLGARLLPGVDLNLWVSLVIAALFAAAIITGVVVAAVH